MAWEERHCRRRRGRQRARRRPGPAASSWTEYVGAGGGGPGRLTGVDLDSAQSGDNTLKVHARAIATRGLVLLTVASCRGDDEYAGLIRSEAARLAKTKIERRLDPTKRSYYETSIWNVATERGETESGKKVWLRRCDFA